MSTTILFAGDINLKSVEHGAVPFSQVNDVLKTADLRFANLECSIFEPGAGQFPPADGIQATIEEARALKIAGFDIVGTANNGNYGDQAIAATIDALSALSIEQVGSGLDVAQAYRAVTLTANGVKVGFLQRTSVYWPIGHEATDHTPGVAVLQGHTSYKLPLHRVGTHTPPLNRPGVALDPVTWADPSALLRLKNDIEELRSTCDIVIASHHWGLKRDVLTYMTEIAHAAIDAGADAVIGHGPHFAMPVEIYRGKPIFYSLSSFCFNVGHSGKRSGNWLGQMASVTFEGREVRDVGFRWVRHTDAKETYFSNPRDEAAALEDISMRGEQFGTNYEVGDHEVKVKLPSE